MGKRRSAERKNKSGRIFKKNAKAQEKTRLRNRANLNLWDLGNMKRAVLEHNSGVSPLSLRGIARAFQVPYTSLQRRVRGVVAVSAKGGRKTLLSTDQESELTDYLIELGRRGFPMSRACVRVLAFKYATANNIFGFDETKGIAGSEWLRGFLHRQSGKLSIRHGDDLAVQRATCMNKPVIESWFLSFSALVKDAGRQFSPIDSWNLDETGLVDVFEAEDVIGPAKGRCFQVTAGDKGETTTVLAAVNAAGQHAPVLIILKGKRRDPELLKLLPEHWDIQMSEKGWIN